MTYETIRRSSDRRAGDGSVCLIHQNSAGRHKPLRVIVQVNVMLSDSAAAIARAYCQIIDGRTYDNVLIEQEKT